VERNAHIPRDERVRIATWNVLHPRFDVPARTAEIARVLADCDVALLQEIAISDTYNSAEEIAEATGMRVASTAIVKFIPGEEHWSATAILTRLPVLRSMTVPTITSESAAAVIALPSGRELVAISAHLEWGGGEEATRVAQVQEIDRAAAALLSAHSSQVSPSQASSALASSADDPVVVLGGDFNALPESDTVRFLTGLASVNGRSTIWADAWGNSDDPGYTNLPASNPLAAAIARKHGLDPQGLPARRIDYLMARGWVWGKAGCSLSTSIRGTKAGPTGVFGSDHCAVVTDMWDPPRESLDPLNVVTTSP
jgi:endonuclease/exonuclease/phosphatase family metal-dependent hydrolase